MGESRVAGGLRGSFPDEVLRGGFPGVAAGAHGVGVIQALGHRQKLLEREDAFLGLEAACKQVSTH